MLAQDPGERVDLARTVAAVAGGGFLVARLARWDALEGAALALGLLAILAVTRAFDRLAARYGPRHLLDVAVPLALLVLVVLAVGRVLELPEEVALLTHPLIGVAAAVIGLGLARLPAAGDAQRRWLITATVGGAAAMALVASFVAIGTLAVWGHLALAGLVLVVWRLVGPVPDPVHPGPSPLRPYAPWGHVQARRWPAWHRLPLRAPATLVYLIVSWGLFLWLGQPQADGFGLDTATYEPYLYSIPQLTRAPLDAAGSLVTALFLNHDDVQLIYVTVLLGLFGLPFEIKEGTGRAATIFAVTGLIGALVAGVLLHGLVALYPEAGFFEQAWLRTWSGGSAGAFGLMGALAARARHPGPLLGFFVFWELNVGAWFLRSYTPAFHLTALTTGYLLARYLLEPPSRP